MILCLKLVFYFLWTYALLLSFLCLQCSQISLCCVSMCIYFCPLCWVLARTFHSANFTLQFGEFFSVNFLDFLSSVFSGLSRTLVVFLVPVDCSVPLSFQLFLFLTFLLSILFSHMSKFQTRTTFVLWKLFLLFLWVQFFQFLLVSLRMSMITLFLRFLLKYLFPESYFFNTLLEV